MIIRHQFHPRSSSVHRQASIGLLRALLLQCRGSSLPCEAKQDFENVVRNRFRANQYVESKRLLTDAFNAGHQALRLLDSHAYDQIQGLLSRTRPVLKCLPISKPSQLFTRAKKKAEAKAAREASEGSGIALPNRSIFSRPHPVVSGRRRVPVFLEAGGYPYLRTRKPEPSAVNTILSRKRDANFKRHLWRSDYERVIIKVGCWEDQWDKAIAKQMNQELLGGETECERNIRIGNTYIGVITSIIEGLYTWLTEDKSKALEIARQMEEIVEKERALAKTEKLARTKLSRERYEGSRGRQPTQTNAPDELSPPY